VCAYLTNQAIVIDTLRATSVAQIKAHPKGTSFGARIAGNAPPCREQTPDRGLINIYGPVSK